MTQCITLALQVLFQQRPRCTGAEGGQLTVTIEVNHTIHPPQVDGQDRSVPGIGIDVTDDGRATAVGNHDDVLRHGIVKQLSHLFAGFGEGDAIGKGVHGTAAHFQYIGKALATGVTNPDFRVGLYQPVVRQA